MTLNHFLKWVRSFFHATFSLAPIFPRTFLRRQRVVQQKDWFPVFFSLCRKILNVSLVLKFHQQKLPHPTKFLKHSSCPWRFQSCVRSKPQFFQWFYSIFTPEIMLMLNLLQCLIFQVCSTSTIWVYSASAPTITMLDLIPRRQNWLQGMLWIQLPVFCRF